METKTAEAWVRGDREARDAEIVKKYDNGQTMTSIGEDYGITHERVRQILNKNGRPTSSIEARDLRKYKKIQKKDGEIAEFLERHGEVIEDLAHAGVSRGEIEERYSLVMPEISSELVSSALSSSAALFERGTPQDLRFPREVIEAAIWYALGRKLGLMGNARDAIMKLDTQEAHLISNSLREEGVSPQYACSVLRIVEAARAHCEIHPETTFTSKSYMSVRGDILDELGFSSRKGFSPWPPTSQTIIKRLGSGYWSDAMKSLRISPGDKGRPRGHLRYDREYYENAVSDYLDHSNSVGQSHSFGGYKEWANAESRAGRRRPSAEAIRLVYPSWTSAKREAGARAALAGTRKKSTASVPGATDSFRRTKQELDLFLENIKSAPKVEISHKCLEFARWLVGEFETRRRSWLRAMILLDEDSVARRVSMGRGDLSKKQWHEAQKPNPNVDSIVDGKYLDRLLSDSDPRKTDMWLAGPVQDELDRISHADISRFAVLRCVRHFITHNDSQDRLEQSIRQLSEVDSRFALRQSVTPVVIGDWLSSTSALRLGLLCRSIQEIWRTMILAEQVATEPVK